MLESYFDDDFGLISEWLRNLIILMGVILYLKVKFLKYHQNRILVGDNITHLLFHNLFKMGYKLNPSGLVGDRELNLPKLYYETTSRLLPFYNRKNKQIEQFNLGALILFEFLAFFILIYQHGLKSAVIGVLALAFIPSLSTLSFSERGSYSKFSERFWALIANGTYCYLFTLLSHSEDSNFLYLVPLFFLGFVSMLLGKFSRQVVVLYSICSFIVVPSLNTILTALFIFILALVAKPVRTELLAQLTYLRNYRLYQSQNFEISLSKAKKYLRVPVLYNCRILRVYLRLFLHSGVGILSMIPTLIAIFYQGGVYKEIAIIALFLALLTTTHVFYFIGSGDRYLYHILTVSGWVLVASGEQAFYLMCANFALTAVPALTFVRKLESVKSLENNKVQAYLKFSEHVKTGDTIFFDHYKDGEIFQLLNGVNSATKFSVTRNYKWDDASRVIFESYPKISKSPETLNAFGASLLVTSDRMPDRADLTEVLSVAGYQLYRVS